MTGTNYEDLLDLPCLQVISDLNTQLSASDPDINMPSKVKSLTLIALLIYKILFHIEHFQSLIVILGAKMLILIT